MNNVMENANRCIECSVTACGHHCGTADYCTLDHICVGERKGDSAGIPCTDCRCFEKK